MWSELSNCCKTFASLTHFWLDVSLFILAHDEFYNIDLDNEDRHGECIVTLCTKEEVNKVSVSSIVIARPNTHPDDLKHLKASFSEDAIEIIGPAKAKSFLTNANTSDGWLTKLKTNKDTFDAAKLCTTMNALVTKHKKKDRLKTTHLNASHLGLVLSNKCFLRGAAEGELKMIPLPYTHTSKVGDKDNTVTKVMCIWRVCIDKSLQQIDEDNGQPASNLDMMVNLMKGATI